MCVCDVYVCVAQTYSKTYDIHTNEDVIKVTKNERREVYCEFTREKFPQNYYYLKLINTKTFYIRNIDRMSVFIKICLIASFSSW